MTNKRLAKDAVLSEFEGSDAVLLDVDAQQYQTLNATAAAIFKGLEENLTDREIALRLTQEFDVSESQAAESVRAFVAKLREQGLVRS